MVESTGRKLVSYIAPSAPATRRPARGDEPFLRPEIGFTPNWYHQALGIDFGERWHTDPDYRRQTIIAMGRELKRRFGSIQIGGIQGPDHPADLLTGVFGNALVAASYGVPIEYHAASWPWSKHQFLSDEEAARLKPPDLDSNPFFAILMEQVEWVARANGRVEGFINWQGVLNNAYRLRGQSLFIDMATEPERVRHVFECVTTTMIDGARRLYERQRQTGVEINHFTVSNCIVNMISPELYREFLLPLDQHISEAFGLIGVHNCAWKADPYLAHYAAIPNLGYVDMGMCSDMPRARQYFPDLRRAIMYTPMDVANKTSAELRTDLDRIAREYGPCDMVFADIDAGTPDERVTELVKLCEEISERVATAL